jgi:hypothetical protein
MRLDVKMDAKTLNELNTLLVFLREFDVVALVREKYALYGNDAPPELLAVAIDDLKQIVLRGYADANQRRTGSPPE